MNWKYFSKAQEKHGNNYSGSQLILWAHMIIAKTYDEFVEPLHVPMITVPVPVPKCKQKESLSDANAATAIAKVLSPTQASSVG